MRKRDFGQTADGRIISEYTLRNGTGMTAEITDMGAALVSLFVPDGQGKVRDVVLGLPDGAAYEKNTVSMGATVGRVANRIAGASFTMDGETYRLTANDGENTLHGGRDFYNHRLWQVKAISENSITLSLFSPHMDQGFPGNLTVEVIYTLTENNGLQIEYSAMSDKDTLLSLTNHSYFNLNGQDSGSVLRHKVWVDAEEFTEADENSIPTGKLRRVAGTPMDFRTPKEIGRDIDADYDALIFGKGYDHNWCLKTGGKLSKVAELWGDESRISMEVYTDMPGVQIYTANYLEGEKGKDGVIYGRRQGICLETQFYPDAIHHENFPSPILPAGKLFHSTTIYRFRT